MPYFSGGQIVPFNAGTFKGTCDTSTNPGTPSADEWWSATEPGIYTNFGGVEVTTVYEVFNYIRWNNNTSTWSVETVPVKLEGMTVPRVGDGILDLIVNDNFELIAQAYEKKKETDPGYAYIHRDESVNRILPSYPLNIEGKVQAGQFFVAYELDGFTTLADIQPPFISISLSENGTTNSGSLAMWMRTIGGNVVAHLANTVPLYIGYLPPLEADIVADGRFVRQDTANDLYQFYFTHIRLMRGEASKMLATDSNKEIVYRSLAPVTLAVFYADVWNVGSSSYDLYTYTLPANTLNTDGQSIEFIFSGITESNSSLKSIEFKINSGTLGGIASIAPAAFWTVKISLIRASNTEIRITKEVIFGASTVLSYHSVSVNLTTDTIFKLSGTAPTTADITAKMGRVEMKFTP